MKKKEIEQEIELAKMMVADIDKIYKKYAKAALEKEKERLERIKNELYNGCENAQELQDLYGYGELTDDEYYGGVEFFQNKKERSMQLSLVEAHRKNLREIRDRWKGTIKELLEELDEIDGKPKDTTTYLEQLERQERDERYKACI